MPLARLSFCIGQKTAGQPTSTWRTQGLNQDTEPVMAELNSRDVVNQSLSVGDLSPAGVPATNHYNSPKEGDEAKQLSEKQGYVAGDTRQDSHEGGPVQPVDVNTALTISTSDSTNGRMNPLTAAYANGSSNVNDASGGSDTDTSRSDGVRGSHVDGSGAVKKTSFKPVSFAKYSVSKVVSSSPTAKAAADKGTLSASPSLATVQPSSRPRLIAKSGSGLRDASLKTYKPAGKNGTGPDPMQVWNKNRAAPAPSTKHLTDEELKQQYGIHMTSRIQADGDGKESKWADIDDDEDDWAPDTIEWNDGTKVSLGQADIPQPVRDAKPAMSSIEPALAAPTKKLQPQVPSSVGPNATILKVGQNAEKHAKAITTHPKGAVEKPVASSTKTPAPVPAKSPWAPLPPVEKSPITFVPDSSISQPQGYFAQFGQQQQASSPAKSPTHEISADDFNRNWRDAQPNGPRELYMPNSGRYEAVNEGRRRPSRNEPHLRQPSVLQRPNATDSRGPAEPSAAFQTSRLSGDQERGQWGRRRASSNVSGGSGQFARRMSTSKAGDFTKIQPGVPQTHQVAPRGASPTQINHDSPRLSHVSSEAVGSSAPIPETEAPAQSVEDPVIVQKRIMAEKRELARRRRQEEEEREEAARRERIRLKLEALGPLPDKSSNKADLVSATGVPPSLKATEDNITSVPQSPPKPPVPEATGEPKQYGMMKVHHPDTVKKMMPQSHASQQLLQSSTMDPSTLSSYAAHNVQEARSDPLKPSRLANDGIRQGSDDVVRQLDRAQENNPGDVQGKGWSDTLSNGNAPTPWAASRVEQQAPKVSVWGSTNNALGNGTFDRSLAEFRGTRGQLPPPGHGARSTLWSNDRSPFPGVDSQFSTSVIGHSDTSQGLPSPDEQPLAANSEVDSMPPTSRPVPIGPPQPLHAASLAPGSRPSSAGLAGWNNFHAVAAREDRAANDRYRHDVATRLEEESRAGLRQQPHVTYNETWRQVDAGEQAGQRQIIGVSRSTGIPPQSIPSFGNVVANPHELIISRPSGVASGTPQRASRFFPSGSNNGLVSHERRAATYSHPEIPSSPSPPPPEELSHPAFYGDIHRPLVSLPKPKAVVRLPPKDPPPPPTPVQRATPTPQTWSAVVGQRAVSTPAPKSGSMQQAQPQNWQSKINALFDQKGYNGERKQYLAVAPSTKDMLDVLTETEMTVSLPISGTASPNHQSSVTSKDVEEEDEIFEDRIPGSLPVVKVPLEVPLLASQPLPTPRHRPRWMRNVDPISATFYPLDGDLAKTASIVVCLPGSTSARRTVPTKRIEHGGGISKPQRHNNKVRQRGTKPREASANLKVKNGSSQQESTSNHGPSSRTGITHQSSNGWKGPGPTPPVSR